jgi:hypothetical protein
MQSTMQAVQQTYLGTRERAVVVLEGWDASGKGGIVRQLAPARDCREGLVLPDFRSDAAEDGRPAGLRARRRALGCSSS